MAAVAQRGESSTCQARRACAAEQVRAEVLDGQHPLAAERAVEAHDDEFDLAAVEGVGVYDLPDGTPAPSMTSWPRTPIASIASAWPEHRSGAISPYRVGP